MQTGLVRDARGGWRRSSVVGEDMPDVDLILAQPVTGVTAWVQIKIGAGQGELDDYIRRFRQDGSWARFVFACSAPKGALALPAGDARLALWSGPALASRAIEAGLFDWLLERTH